MTIWIRFNSTSEEYFEYDDGLPEPPKIHCCLCCGFKTLPSYSDYEICPICFWQDVHQGEHNLDFRDPWNHRVSLRTARQNYLRYSACRKSMKRHVREPLPEERVGAKAYR